MEIAKKIELLPNEIKGLESLPEDKKIIIQSMVGEKVLSGLKKDGVTFVFEVIKITEINSGLTKLDNKDLTALSFSVYELINEDFKNLTKLELKAACKNGVIGNYGQWFGMCLKTFNEWIKAYLNHETRKQAIKEWNLAIEKSQFSNVPVANIDFFDSQSCINAFNTYKTSKIMPLAPFAYYDILNERLGTEYNGLKTLITDKEVRQTLVEQSDFEFVRLCTMGKKKYEKMGDLSGAEKIMDYLLEDKKGLKGYERIVKANFLKHYFETLIAENKEMKLINGSIQLEFTEDRF